MNIDIDLDFRICKANLEKINSAIDELNSYNYVVFKFNEDWSVTVESDCDDKAVNALIDLLEILIN